MTKAEREKELEGKYKAFCAGVITGLVIAFIAFAGTQEPIEGAEVQTETESEWDMIRWKQDTEFQTKENSTTDDQIK